MSGFLHFSFVDYILLPPFKVLFFPQIPYQLESNTDIDYIQLFLKNIWENSGDFFFLNPGDVFLGFPCHYCSCGGCSCGGFLFGGMFVCLFVFVLKSSCSQHKTLWREIKALSIMFTIWLILSLIYDCDTLQERSFFFFLGYLSKFLFKELQRTHNLIT